MKRKDCNLFLNGGDLLFLDNETFAKHLLVDSYSSPIREPVLD